MGRDVADSLIRTREEHKIWPPVLINISRPVIQDVSRPISKIVSPRRKTVVSRKRTVISFDGRIFSHLLEAEDTIQNRK